MDRIELEGSASASPSKRLSLDGRVLENVISTVFGDARDSDGTVHYGTLRITIEKEDYGFRPGSDQL